MLDGSPRPLESCLARVAAVAPARVAELENLRRRAWLEQGIVVVRPAELADDWLQQRLVSEATRRWGRRMRGRS